jgi:hypothetical protein
MVINTGGNVGIGTADPIAALDINGGAENNTTPALSIRGGLYDPSDLYVLNTYNVNTGVGFAAKVIGVNIKNKVETDNTVQIRNNVGGITSAGAIYLGSDDVNQGIFGVLGGTGIAGSTLAEYLTVRAGGNVGIGDTSPSYKLNVNGSFRVSGGNTSTFGNDGLLHINSRSTTHGSETVALQTTIDGRALTDSNPGTHGSEDRNVLALQPDGGYVGIGTTNPGAKLHVNGPELRVTNADTAVAQISAFGSSQGTGRLYVGQSSAYGGGIEYNGDNSPASTGAGADYVTLYRVDNGTYNWTARNIYNNNNWEFRGNVKTPLLDVNGTTMSKAPRVIHIDDNRSGCPPTHAANTPIMQHSLTLSRTAYVYVSVTTILNRSTRADCYIYFNSSVQQSHLTAEDSTAWNPVNITAGGSLGAGTHTIKFQCNVANVVGCGQDWGGMQILVFEQ